MFWTISLLIIGGGMMLGYVIGFLNGELAGWKKGYQAGKIDNSFSRKLKRLHIYDHGLNRETY